MRHLLLLWWVPCLAAGVFGGPALVTACGAVQQPVEPDVRAAFIAAAAAVCVELRPAVADHVAARLAWAFACGALVAPAPVAPIIPPGSGGLDHG